MALARNAATEQLSKNTEDTGALAERRVWRWVRYMGILVLRAAVRRLSKTWWASEHKTLVTWLYLFRPVPSSCYFVSVAARSIVELPCKFCQHAESIHRTIESPMIQPGSKLIFGGLALCCETNVGHHHR